MDTYYQSNPEKVKEWYDKGKQVKSASDSLYNYVQDLKQRIAVIADGKDANVNKIEHKDDLEAASRIMLGPVTGEGKKLREAIDAYRVMMGEMVQDQCQDPHPGSKPEYHTASQGRDQYPHLGRSVV